MKSGKKVLDVLSKREKNLLTKILDPAHVTALNGFSKDIERQILKKTGVDTINELLSRLHHELITIAPEGANITNSINFWLKDIRLKHLQLVTNQAVRILDNSSKKYLYINEANQIISGIPNEVFLKEGLWYSNSRTHPWDLFQLVLLIRNVMKAFNNLSYEEKINSRFSFDIRYKHPERGYMRIQQHIMPLTLTKEGKPGVILIASSDISELKKGNKMHYHFGVFIKGRFKKILQGSTTAYGSVLTDREIEILHHISLGMTTKEIAEKIYLSPATVRTHTKNIQKKTDSRNMIDVVRKAVLNGWI